MPAANPPPGKYAPNKKKYIASAMEILIMVKAAGLGGIIFICAPWRAI